MKKILGLMFIVGVMIYATFTIPFRLIVAIIYAVFVLLLLDFDKSTKVVVDEIRDCRRDIRQIGGLFVMWRNF